MMDPPGQNQLDKKQLLQQQQLLLQKHVQQHQQQKLVQSQSQQQQQLLQTQPQPQLQQHKESLLTQQVLQQENLKQQQLILGSQQTQLKDNNDEKEIQKQLQTAQQRPHLIHQQQHRQQQEQQQQLQELQQKLLQPQQQSQLVQQQIQQQSQFIQQTQQQQQPNHSQFVQKLQQTQTNQPQSSQQSQLVQQTQLQQSQLIHQTQQQYSQDLQQSHVVQNTQVLKQRHIVQKPTVVQQSQIIQQPQNVQQSHVIQKTQQQQQQLQYATVSTQQKIKLQPPHSQQQLQQQLQQLLSKNKNYPQRIVVLGSQPQQQSQQHVTQQQQQMVMQQQKQLGTQHQHQMVMQQQQQLGTQQQQQLGTQQQQQLVTQQQSVSQQSQCVVTNPTSQQQQILPQQMQCLVVTGTGQQQMQRVVITSTGQQQQQQQLHRVVAGTGKQQQRVVVGASGQQDLNQIQHVVVQGTSQHQTQPLQNIVNAGAIQHQTRQMQCVVVTSASGQQQQLQPAAQRLVVCQPKQSHQIQHIKSSSQCGVILGQSLHQDIKQPMTVTQQQHRVSIASQKQLPNLPVHPQKSLQQLPVQQPKPQQVVEQLQQKQQVIQQKQQPQRVVITQQQQHKVNISDQSLLQELHIKQSHQQLQQLHIQPSQKPLQEQQLNTQQQQPQNMLQQQLVIQKQQKEQPEQLNRSGVIVGKLQPPARPEPEKMQQQHKLQQQQRQKLQEHLIQQHLKWQQQQQQQKQVHDQQSQQKNRQQQLREKVLLKQHLKYQQKQQLQQQLLFRQQALSENRVLFAVSNNHEQKQQDDKKTINQTENTPVQKSLQQAIKNIPEEQIKLDVKRQVDRVAIDEEKLMLLSSSSDEDDDDDTIRKQRNILIEAKRLVHERHDALSAALGPKCQGHYDRILKQWLDGQLSRDNFDIEIRKVLTTITENNDLNKNDIHVIAIDNSSTNMKTASITKKETISIATTSKSATKDKKDAKKNVKNHTSILEERLPFHNALVTSLIEWMPLNRQWMERRMARARGVTETGCPLRLYTYADVPQTRGASNHWYSEEPGSLVRWYSPDQLPYSSSTVEINDEKQLLQSLFQGKRNMEKVNAKTAAVTLRPPSRTWLPLMLRMATDTEAEQGDRWLKENSTMLNEDIIKRLQWQRLKAKKQLLTMVRLRNGHTKLLHELKIRSRELENEEHRLVERLRRLQKRITKRRRQILAVFKVRLLELQDRIRRYFDRSWLERPEYQAQRQLLIKATKTIENEEIDEDDEDDDDEDRQYSFLKHLEKFQLLKKNGEKQEKKTKTTTSTLQLSYRDRWPQSSALTLRLLRDRQRYRTNHWFLKIIRKERLLVINHTDRVRELRHKHCPCGESNDQPCRYQNQMRRFRNRLREHELDAMEAENKRKLAEEEAKKELAEESKKQEDALIENKKIESKKIQVNTTKVVSRKRKAKTVKSRPNKKKAMSKLKVKKIVTANSVAVDVSSTKKPITADTIPKSKTTNNTKTTNTICSPIATTKISTVGTIVPRTSDIVSSVVPVGINSKLYRSERLLPTQVNVLVDSGIRAQKDKKKGSRSIVAAASRKAQLGLESSRPIQQRRSKALPVAAPIRLVDENDRRASELMPPPPPPKSATTRKTSIGSRYLQQHQLLLNRQRQLVRMRQVEKERQRVYDEQLKQQQNDLNWKEEGFSTDDETMSSSSSKPPLSTPIMNARPFSKHRNVVSSNCVRESELKHKQRYLQTGHVNKLKQKIPEEIFEPLNVKSSTIKRKPLRKQLQTKLSKQPSKSDQKTTTKNRQSLKEIKTKYKNKLIKVEGKQKQLQCELKLDSEPILEHKPTELKAKEILGIKNVMIPPVTNNNQQSIYVCNRRLQDKCTNKSIIPEVPLSLVGKDELEITMDNNELQFVQGKIPVTQQPNMYKVDICQERSLEEEGVKKLSKAVKHSKLCETQEKIVKIQLVDKCRKLLSEIVLHKCNCKEMNNLIDQYLKLLEDLLPEQRLQHLVSLQQQLKSAASIENITDDLKSSVDQNPEKELLPSLTSEENQIRSLLSQIRFKQEKIHQSIEVLSNDVRGAKGHIKYIRNAATNRDKSVDDVGPINDDQYLGFNSELNSQYYSCDTRSVQNCGHQLGQYERKHLERDKIECQQLRNNKNTQLELMERRKKNSIKKIRLENQNYLKQVNRYKRIKQLEHRKCLLVKRRQQEQQEHQERLKQLLERQQEQLRPKCHWMIRKTSIHPKPYFDKLFPLHEQLMRKIIENKNSRQLLEIEQQEQRVMRITKNKMKRGSRYWWTKIGLKRQISPLVINKDRSLDLKLAVTMPIAHQPQFTRPQMGAIAGTVIVKNRKPITPSLLTFTEKKNLKKLLSPQLIQLMTKAEGKCLEELQTKFVDLNRRVDLHWKAMMEKQQQQVQVLLQYEKQKQEQLKLENQMKLHEDKTHQKLEKRNKLQAYKTHQELEKQKRIQEDNMRRELEKQNRLQEETMRKELEKPKKVEQQTQQQEKLHQTQEQYVNKRNELIKQQSPIVFLENLELQQNNMLYKNAQENLIRKQHMDQRNKLLAQQQPVIILEKLKHEKYRKFAEKQEKEKIIQQQLSVLAKDVIEQQHITAFSQKQSEPVENKINLPRVENEIVTLVVVADPMRDVSKIWRELESMRMAHQTRWKIRLRQLFEIKWINKTFARELYDRLIKLHNSSKRKQKKPKAIASLKLLQHRPLKPAERQKLHRNIQLQKTLIQQQKSSVLNRPIQKRKTHQQQQSRPKTSPVELKSPRNMPLKQQEKQSQKVVSTNNQKLCNKRLAIANQPIQTQKKQGQQKSNIELRIRQNQQYLDHQKQKPNSLPKSSMVASSLNVQPKPQKRLNSQRLMSSVSTIADTQKKSQQEECCNTSIKWILRKLTFLLHNQRIVLERQLSRLNNTQSVQQEPSVTQNSIPHTYTTSMILTPAMAKQQLSISPVMQATHSEPEKQQSKQCQVLKERLTLVISQLKPLMELWQLSLRFPGHWLAQQLDDIEQIQQEEIKESGRKRNQNDEQVVPTATVKKQRSWQQLQRICEYLECRQNRITELLSELAEVMHREQHRVLSKSKGLRTIQPALVYSVLLKLQQPLSQIQQSPTYTVVLNLKQPLASKSESLTYSALLSLQIPSTTNPDPLKYSALLKLSQPSKSNQISSNNTGLLKPHNSLMPKKPFSMTLAPQQSLVSKHKSNASVTDIPKLISKEKISVTPTLQADKPSISSLSNVIGNENDQRQRSTSKKRPISPSNPIRSKKLRRLRSKKHHCTKNQGNTINGENTDRRQHEASTRKRKVRRRRHSVRTVTVDTHGPAVPTFRDHGFSDGSMERVVHGRFVATLMTMNTATSIASSVRPRQPSIPLECAIKKDNSNGPRIVSDNDNNRHNTSDKVTVSTNTPVKLSSIMDVLEKAEESHANSGRHSTHFWNGCARTIGTTLVTMANLAKKQMTNEPLSTMRKSRPTASKTKLVTEKNPASASSVAKPSSSSLLQTIPLDKLSKSGMESIGAGNIGKLSSTRPNKRSASVAFSSSNKIKELDPNSPKCVTVQPHKRSKSAVITTTTSKPEKVFPSSKTSVMSELTSSSNAVVIGSPNRSKSAVPTTGAKTTHASTPTETVSTAATKTETAKITDNVKEMTKTITEEHLRTVTVTRTLCPTVPAPMDVSADACSLVVSTCKNFIRAMVIERLSKTGHGVGTAELRRRDLYAAAMATDDNVRPVPEFGQTTTLGRTAGDRPVSNTSIRSTQKQQSPPQSASVDVLNESTVRTVETVVDTQTTTTETVTVGDKRRSTVTSVSGMKTKWSPTVMDPVAETSARTRGIVAWKTTRKRTEDGQRPGEMASIGQRGFLVERGRPLLRPEFHRRRPFGTLAVTCAMAAAKTTAVNDAAYTCFGGRSDGVSGDGGRERYNNGGDYFGDPKLLPPVSRLNRYLVDDDSVAVFGGSGDGNRVDNDEHHRILSKTSTRTGWQQRRQWSAVGVLERRSDVLLEEEEALLARHQRRLMDEIGSQQQQRKRLEQDLKQRTLELQNRVPDSEEEHYRKFLRLQYGSPSANAPPSTTHRAKVDDDDDGPDLISW